MAAIDLALRRLRDDGGSDLLRPERINQLALEQGHKFRERTLTPGRTLQLFVQQIAWGNIACSAMRHLAGEEFSDSAWCQARSRLPSELIVRVHEQVIEQARAELDVSGDVGEGPYCWHGHRVYLIDGSSDSMPDTPALREHYGVPGGVREGLGFPTSHLLLTMDQRSGLLVHCIDSPRNSSDLSQTPQAHQHLREGDIVLGDDTFSGWGHLALILQAKLHAVTPVHHKRIVDFTAGRAHVNPRKGNSTGRIGKPRSRVLQTLGEEDQIVEYFKPLNKSAWLSDEQWAQLPDSIVVREIHRTVQRKGFRPISVTIVTTLLDPLLYPADELIELRLSRWMVETNIRHLKITLGMDVLKCKTPPGVRRERLVFLLVYNLIRILMLRVARQQRVNVNRLSFADALAWVRLGDVSCLPSRLKENPLRSARLEPRVLKRQKKEFPYMTVPRAQLKSQLRALHGDTP
jgi:hypothetical protein